MYLSDSKNVIPTIIIDSDAYDSPKTPKFSTPYKRIRALRLFNNDAHHNPKALRSSCSTSLYSKFMDESPLRAIGQENISFSEYQNNNCLNGSMNRSKDSNIFNLSVPPVNINPFSSEGGQLTASRKRSYQQHKQSASPELNTTHISDDCFELDTIRNVSSSSTRELRSSNISRYHEEFHGKELVGTGRFASVYKCINRLDGCVYAVKKITKAVVQSASANLALKEVYAHAVLGRHPHVVRYYSAWCENDHMIIQNEYCNGGSLQDKLEAIQQLEVWDLRKLLRQVAEGLRFIHASGLVHLDIKPSNIFVSRERRCMLFADPYGSADDAEMVTEDREEEVEVYKIGDLGHVAPTRLVDNTASGNGKIEEGDCRYLALEILHEDYALLPASDIFSLGITTLEAAGICQSLPKGGTEWHELRSGIQQLSSLSTTDHLPAPLTQLINQMLQPEKERRPTATCIVQHNAVQPEGCKSRPQLYRELNAEKVKNDFLQKQLLEMMQRLSRGHEQKVGVATGRLVGGKHVNKSAVYRSNSTSNF